MSISIVFCCAGCSWLPWRALGPFTHGNLAAPSPRQKANQLAFLANHLSSASDSLSKHIITSLFHRRIASEVETDKGKVSSPHVQAKQYRMPKSSVSIFGSLPQQQESINRLSDIRAPPSVYVYLSILVFSIRTAWFAAAWNQPAPSSGHPCHWWAERCL